MLDKTESLDRQLVHEIKAGNTLIFIETQEEDEVEFILKKIAEILEKGLNRSDLLQENINLLEDEDFEPMSSSGRFSGGGGSTPTSSEPELIDKIQDIIKERNTIYLIKDIASLLNTDAGRTLDPIRIAKLIRTLNMLRKQLSKQKSVIILMNHTYYLPKELENNFIILFHRVPDTDMLKKIFYDYVADTALMSAVQETPKALIDNIVRSAKGLTADQFRRCIASTIIRHQEIGAKTIDEILKIKKEIIQKDGMLEYIEEEVNMSDVGGLNNLKDWAKKRKRSFSIEAEKRGLPTPKGILVWGVPGTGKSLISKAISSIWRRPILRFDIGRIFGSYVGESEKNMRSTLRIAESIAPCILWIDEIEKAFSSADRGSEVSNRVLGTFLTWMQEKAQTEKVFIVATANDVTLLPPELLRKGRFDQLFFVDRPDEITMKEIISIQLQKYKLDPNKYNIDGLSKKAYNKELTGSEIEQIVIDAKYNAFDNDQDPDDKDIKKAIDSIKLPIASYFYKNAEKNEKYKQVDMMSIDA